MKIPDQLVEKELAPHIGFPDVAYLEIEKKVIGNEVALKNNRFSAPTHSETCRNCR
ncbi:MAG: hypothetical protein J7K51_09105 [Thermotogae bacterium]|nr:hypothetical protein [Thermotogota bacterium]